MRFGIMGAMPNEVDLLLEDMVAESETIIAGRTFHSGCLYGSNAVVVFSRIGKVASATTATILLSEFDVDAVVFAGVAGAVSRQLDIGDVVVATELIQHDLDARPLFERFEAPLLGKKVLPVDRHLTRALAQAATEFLRTGLVAEAGQDALDQFGIARPKVTEGLVASGDQFIADAARSDHLREILPAVQCVEMEGAAVAQVCFEHEAPLAIVRVVSDRTDHQAHFDFSAFVGSVASHYTRGIVRELFRSFDQASASAASTSSRLDTLWGP